MQTLAELYEKYKGADCHTGSDKGTIHSYIPVYEQLFAPYRLRLNCKVLEIGLLTGDSLKLLESYFHLAEVIGVDLNDQPMGLADLRPMLAEGSHHIKLFNAADSAQVEDHFGSLLFDVVIEDASHAVSDQLAIYHNFRQHMTPGGIYIIEDIENIDRDRALFEAIDPQRPVRIIDLRHVKNRFDDVLVVIGGK